MSRHFAHFTGILLVAATLTACSGNAPATTAGSTTVGQTITTSGQATAGGPATTGGQSATDGQTTGSPSSTTAQLELTLEELAKYNGENGNPAYVAVDGIIYDVTNAPPWKGGQHNGFTAGRDLTNEIKTVSPHGIKMLEKVPAVGRIKQ